MNEQLILDMAKPFVKDGRLTYLGMKEYNGFVIGAYCDDQILTSEKIVTISLFDEPAISLSEATSAEEYIELVEEADYIKRNGHQ